ncbi:MAG: hypothetical protein OXI69_09780 [Acidobacteriota bacterium]|nr:hypothetical protein [Acidobacteriota bacterium]
MSDLCPTLASLIDIGFERRKPRVGMETVGFKFNVLDLVASYGINRNFRTVVLLGGILQTKRTLGLVDSEISPDLGSAREAAAWISYALKSHRSDLEPLPAWFVEGELHWDLIPFVRHMRDYEARPQCYVDREYARTLRRKLRAALSDISRDTEMSFSFDGRVLSITLCGTVHEVIASGTGWTSAYSVMVGHGTALPTRFTCSAVEVSVFEGVLTFGNIRLKPCKATT